MADATLTEVMFTYSEIDLKCGLTGPQDGKDDSVHF